MLLSNVFFSTSFIMKTISLISWNVRGVCNKVSRRLVKEAILEHKTNVVYLQETKCSSWNALSIRKLCGNQDFDWVEVPAKGLSGGLLCMWNTIVYKMISVEKDDNWVWCKFQSLVDDKMFSVVNVYSAQDMESKKNLWIKLASISSSLQNERLCFIGDFNSIRDESERKNCSYRRGDTEGFNKFIDNSNLLELALVNSEYTWYGPGGRKSKLDRAMVNSEWWSEGHWHLQALSRKKSDHKALLLSQNQQNWGPVPFKVFNCWLKDLEL